MSENKMQESLTNVIAEGRSYKGFPVPYAPARAIWLDDFNSFLDRIEAAHKREVEKLNSVIQATVSHSDAEIDRLRREVAELRKQIGNAAKLREALVKLVDFCSRLWKREKLTPLLEKARAAIAKPPRNCDVGTAEEQLKRQHDTMCNTTKACPDSDWSCRKCFAEWSQMPYSESEVSHGNA